MSGPLLPVLPRPAATPAAVSPLGAGGHTPSPDKIAKLRQSASDFEAMALSEMLQPMFKTVDMSKGMFGGGAGEATWKPMMVDEMAKTIARAGGLGIGDAIFKQMLRTQEQHND
jgi:Rod binding domain-containing protein